MLLSEGNELDQVSGLLSEINCRIEHGADSGGHLEYVEQKLREIISGADNCAPCDLGPDGTPHRY